MADKKVYVGLVRMLGVTEIVLTQNPNELSGKRYEITSENGEGSFFEVLQKLKEDIEDE